MAGPSTGASIASLPAVAGRSAGGMDVDEIGWRRLLRAQDGVVRRSQALALGWTERALAHRSGRDWQVLLPGVLLVTTGVPTTRQLRRAAVVWAGPGAALTARVGLAEHGALDRPGPEVHVAVPHARQVLPTSFGSRVDAGVPARRQQSTWPGGTGSGPRAPVWWEAGSARVVPRRTHRTLVATGALPVLPVARCIVDACLGERRVVQVRSLVSGPVQQGRVTVEQVAQELELGPRRGSALLRQVLAEVSAGARSAPEATLLPALRAAGLTGFELNVDVYEQGRWLARPDVVWRSLWLIVEVDGARWHATQDRWAADVDRHTRLEAAGWTVLRYPAHRVLADAAGVAAEIAAVVSRIAS